MYKTKGTNTLEMKEAVRHDKFAACGSCRGAKKSKWRQKFQGQDNLSSEVI